MTEVCCGDGSGKIRILRRITRQVLLWGVVGRDVSILWTALATLETGNMVRDELTRIFRQIGEGAVKARCGRIISIFS